KRCPSTYSMSLVGGYFMSAKLQNALLDLLVALGLCERPKLQPIPVRSNSPDSKAVPPRP
ncbi:MAG TPA: PA1414 family protein, partial [Methylophilaceae bacterium]|nr:PA1414 family protein [Methylophilaceae bacterium]